MSKSINKNSIVSSPLIITILVVLAFGLMSLPNTAGATAGYVDNPTPTIDSVSAGSEPIGMGPQTVTIKGFGFLPTSVVKVNGTDSPTTFIDYSHLLVKLNGNTVYASETIFITVFNGAPGGGYSNTIEINSTPVAPVNTNQNTNASALQDSNQPALNDSEQASSLASNAIFGTNSFAPSGIIQWIFFAIIILILVIIVRKFFGGADRYHNTPLKHS